MQRINPTLIRRSVFTDQQMTLRIMLMPLRSTLRLLAILIAAQMPLGLHAGMLQQVDSTCDAPVFDSCCCIEPSLFVSLDYLNWQMTTRGNDFAISELGNATTLGTGQVHHIGLDRDSGFRSRIGYRTAAGWSLSLQYTDFNTSGRSTLERPAGIGQLFATQSHPDGNEEANQADALAGFDYQVLDLIVERIVLESQFTRTQIFGGIRWADIGQLSSVRYDGRDFTNALVEKASSVEGAGIRMGAASDWLLAKGFRLHGQISGGVLFSEINSRHLETNFDDVVTLVDVFDGRDGALPFLHTAVGVGWQHRFVSILLGYELENWFGLHDRSMFVDDIHEATYATISEDVLLSGLFVNMTFSR